MYDRLGVVRYLVLIIFVTFANTTAAQQSVADSLMVVLKKHVRDDIAKVNIMNDIAYAVYNNNSAMAGDYARKSGQLSDQLGYKKGKATSLWLLGLSNLGRDKKNLLIIYSKLWPFLKK